MIRVNLLPIKDAERAIGRRQRVSIAVLGLCIALLIMLLPFLYQQSRLRTLDSDIKDVQDQIKRYSVQVKEVTELDRLKKDLETKLRIIEELDEKRVGPARVLSDLSHATPGNLWLINFDEGNGAATLTGTALDNETIARFMRALQESPYFYGVDLVETSRNVQKVSARTGEQDVSFTRFIVKAKIDYFGRGGKPSEADLKAAKEAAASAQAGKPANGRKHARKKAGKEDGKAAKE
jgi:type IV pilus assembly protein PilN